MIQKAMKKRMNILHTAKNVTGGWLLLSPLILVMYFVIWRPQVMGGVWSFFSMRGYTPKELIGLKNYLDVISDTQFVGVLINTFKYVGWSLLIGFIPPLLLALMINEVIHFKNTFKIAIYFPSIIPGVAAMLIWNLMYYPDSTGLLNMLLNALGKDAYVWLEDKNMTIILIVISMTWKGMGGGMLLYYSALQGINTELYEAAVIDGAKPVKRLLHITLPQISGVIVLNFVRQIIGVFQIMEQPMAMTGGGPNGASISMGYQLYRYGFVTGRTGHALALGTIMFLILIVVTIFYFFLDKKIEENF